MKKFLSVLLVLLIAVSQTVIFFPKTISSASTEISDILEFTCGANATAFLDKSTKTLTLRGKGSVCFFYEDYPPWASYYSYYDKAVVEEGITELPPFVFRNAHLKKLTLPASLEVIGECALSIGDVQEIVIPENSRLETCVIDDYFKDITWYENQPDGPLYLGRCLIGYKGTIPQNTTIEIKEGTYSISSKAFYQQENIVDIVVPESVERVGYRAFYMTSWQKNQPTYEPLYIGKALYRYNHPWKAVTEADLIDELVIPEGIVSITEKAFDQNVYKKVIFPESLEVIGKNAFANAFRLLDVSFEKCKNLEHIDDAAFYNATKLTEITLPECVVRIDDNAFYSCDLLKGSFYVPKNVEQIGIAAFNQNFFDSFAVDPDNPYFSSDENGFLYNKDKTVLLAAPQVLKCDEFRISDSVIKIGYQALASTDVKKFILPKSIKEICFEAFSESGIESIEIPYGVELIGTYAFSQCSALKEVTLSKSIKHVDKKAFSNCSKLKTIIIPAEVEYISNDAFYNNSNLTIYCYKDSPAYYYATTNDLKYAIIQPPDTSELDALLDAYNTLDRNKYLEESLAQLDEAVSNVDFTKTVITQTEVDEWTANIKTCMNSLKFLPADYYAVNAAVKRTQSINRSLYTAESLAILDAAVASVDYEIDISNQNIVTAYAKTIDDAINALEYLPANYDSVYAAIDESKKVERRLYSQESLTVLDQSINSVNFDLNITEQDKVEGYAQKIYSAIEALKYADVILRNEPHGVIVSATAKEIDPDTSMTVDLKDSSDLQSGNFAVGGTVKSITLYDINLLLNAEKTQPSGFVTVKIKLPEGVDPNRCKVYHIINDPVDPLVRYATTLEGNFIVFETDHFSEFALIEVETVLSGISITQMPSKLTYALSEKIDLTDMKITALLSDGTSQTITDYDVSSVDTSSVGTKTVTVYYTYGKITKSASFEITVSADKIAASISCNGENVTEINKKVKWYVPYFNESLKLDCNCNIPGIYTVKWNSDNDKILVDSNGNVTNKGFFFPRKATITATVIDSAGNVISQDSIVVRFYKLNFQFSGLQYIFGEFKRNGIRIF